MTAARSFTSPFQMTDWTETLTTIQNQWSLIQDSGLFRDESVTQNNITIEETNQTLSLITDSYRGSGRNKVNKDDNRKLHALVLPHFNLQDAISPLDLVSKRAYGSADMAETEAAVMARKLARIQRNWDATMEAARCQAITGLTAFAPNNTVAINYLTEFSASQTTVDFVFSVPTTDVFAGIETVLGTVQDNIMNGETVTGVRVYCSPGFFASLVGHAKMLDAYKYFSSNEGNNPNRDRLGGQGLFRRFVTNGVEFVEYRGQFNGVPLIPANQAFAVPLGTQDMFISYYGPAEKFGLVNTAGEKAYVWTYRDAYDEQIEIHSESNFLHLVRRPSAIVKLTKS